MSISESSSKSLDRAKKVISTVGSVVASGMVVRTVLINYVPREVQDYFYEGSRNYYNRLMNQLTFNIYEFEGLVRNQLYEDVELYFTSRISDDVLNLKISKVENEKNIVAAIEGDQRLTDYYDGIKIKLDWLTEGRKERSHSHNRTETNSTSRSDARLFRLTFHKKHQEKVLKSYMHQITEEAEIAKNKKRTIKIHTCDPRSYSRRYWSGVNLDHPSTFDTLAMDSSMKEMVMKDLERFVSRKDYYRKVGKAWKRGYLLYGPPGTGKSSLIAAMANYLKFDIYDLELTNIRKNSDLRQLLVNTANRSIMVVEDIDCSIELQDRTGLLPPKKHREDKEAVTLSGFLNFIDGLWSSCGDERIIIFTTNHKEKLDPALLRPGRMDLHIHMSYCTPCAFKQLAFNYLRVKEHPLFGQIEDLIAKTEVSPAEVAEQLSKDEDLDVVLIGLIDFLYIKTKLNEEAKIKKMQLAKETEEAINKKLQEEKNEKEKSSIEKADTNSDME